MTVKEITKRSDIQAFVKFPLKLYKHCPQYVPSLTLDEMDSLRFSPCLKYCKRKMWLAYDDKGGIVGRVAGIINPRANEIYHYSRVRFGWFDFIDDFEVAAALIKAVADWGAAEGMSEIHGPLGYNTWSKQGMLIEGFENTSQFNCLYNYAYYSGFMDRLGFAKEVDWLQYIMPASQDLPQKVEQINGLILKKYHLRILDWKNAKEIEPYMFKLFETYNESFKTVHNFIPLSEEEIKANIRFYMRFLKPELNVFVLSPENEVAAFGVSVPNLSSALKKARGRLFPFGWYHIGRALRHYTDIDLMLSGAAPQWKGKGISSVYHARLNQTAIDKKLRWAITNPQIEDNQVIQIWHKYRTQPYMRRRCYIKNIT